MKKIELLAPAGNMECLIAAIDNGADAIYLGGKNYSARAYADNFDDEQLIEAIKYSHIRGVKVYIGINTTLYDDEIKQIIDFVDKMYLNDVDGLIVSDFGLINILKNRYPSLQIHISTQFNVHNLWQVKLLENLNVDRIILARETSISTIKYIKQNSNIDIEVFAHGALCVCYSGNCLHSSMIGKRSGNRGKCAQPCRMEYTLLENGKAKGNKKYLLSMKDLNTLENIGSLIDAGVSSLKIEGRMKSKEYVALITKTYRDAIDNYYLNNINYLDFDALDKIKKVYSRDFTKGFLFNENNKNITNTSYPSHLGTKVGQIVGFKNNRIQIKLSDTLSQQDKITILNTTYPEIKMYVSKIYVKGNLVKQGFKGETIEIAINSKINKDAFIYKTIDSNLVNEIEHSYLSNKKRVPIRMKFIAAINEPMALVIKDNNNHSILVKSDYCPERAINSPTSNNKIEEQLSKLNDTPYYLNNINIVADDNIIIPIKFINDLRRKGIEQISLLREKFYQRSTKDIIDNTIYNEIKKSNNRLLKVKVMNMEQLDAISNLNGINQVYYSDLHTFKKAKEKYPKMDIVPVLSRIINDKGFEVENKCYVINNYGDLLKHKDDRLICDQYMNVTNMTTIEELFNYNVNCVTLSSELNHHQIRKITDSFREKYNYVPPLEMVVYGKIQTMITKHCFIAKEYGFERKNCGTCKNKSFSLLDRMNYEFPIITDDDCNVTIYNSKALNLIEYINEIYDMNISSIRLDFSNEKSDEVYEITKAFIDKIENNSYDYSFKDVTYGYFLDDEKN